MLDSIRQYGHCRLNSRAAESQFHVKHNTYHPLYQAKFRGIEWSRRDKQLTEAPAMTSNDSDTLFEIAVTAIVLLMAIMLGSLFFV